MKSLQGVVVSPGIAIGRAYVYQPGVPVAVLLKVDDVEQEITRFRHALEVAKAQIESIQSRAIAEVGEETAAIFAAHAMFLEDPELLGQITGRIEADGINAEFAVQETIDSYAAIFAAMEDEYMCARGADIEDVGQRLLRVLMGKEEVPLSELRSPVIVIAHDLTPSDTARMNKEMVLGFATETGGKTSHTAIMARILGIPAVVALGQLLDEVQTGNTIIVDGGEGLLVVGPDDGTISEYQSRRGEDQKHQDALRKDAQLRAVTADGHAFDVAANIGDVESARSAVDFGAEGVGLLRTEFLYLNRTTLPDEEEQYQAYVAIAEAMGGRPIVIRTLDIGGDKQLPYLDIGEEQNPFLGWRAIRYCLDHPELFKTQLRAILRAGALYNLRMMFPMIATLDETRRAKRMVEEAKDELRSGGYSYDPDIEVGIMIEIPAAALAADALAREVDFFSIGTNDLIQYTMACDRGNERVGYLYEPLHPTILRLIQQVIAAAHRHGKYVGMCGEMAGDPEAIPLLLGMSIDLLSMNPAAIPRAKQVIREIRIDEALTLADEAVRCCSAEEVRALVAEFMVAVGGSVWNSVAPESTMSPGQREK